MAALIANTLTGTAYINEFSLADSGIGHAGYLGGSALALPIDMRVNTQTVPVEPWETEPKLKVVQRNGDKAASNGSRPKMSTPTVVPRRERPELKVLTWEARVGRLVGLSRGSR